MYDTFIGVGSNLGDRLENIARAVDAISDLPDTHVAKVSTAYVSKPWGGAEQPNYGNAVVEVETTLEPQALLDYLKEIEEDMGREPAEAPNSPRVIDLDILLMGDTEMQTEELTIPHPRLLERDFVVAPLLELWPEAVLPNGSRVVREQALQGEVITELGCVPDWGEEHNEPVYADHWVVIAESEMAQNVAAGFDPSLMLKRQILEEEGIPFAWDPYEPGATEDPWGAYTIYRMLVPQRDAPRALAVITEALSAEPEFPEEPEDY